jgi:hypothetical protein
MDVTIVYSKEVAKIKEKKHIRTIKCRQKGYVLSNAWCKHCKVNKRNTKHFKGKKNYFNQALEFLF